jgi:hypothetical protein
VIPIGTKTLIVTTPSGTYVRILSDSSFCDHAHAL